MIYEIIKRSENDQGVIKKIDDTGFVQFIPMDEANADYQAYLAWLAEQPTPKASK